MGINVRLRRYAFPGLGMAIAFVAPAAAQDSCNGYFTRSQSLGTLVGDAYAAMSDKDMEAMKRLLPSLEAAFAPISATEVKPEVCDDNHINAYTSYQNSELNFLRSRSVDIGFPVNLPIVKQPDLNQRPLAYAVGWIKYELSDFAGALTAFEKGLAMFPHDAELQNEYLATLLQLKRYSDIIAYTDQVLATAHDSNDETRAKIYNVRGIGLFWTNQLKAADESLGVSLKYFMNDDVTALQKQVQAAMAAKPN